ncbi:MAG: homoserine O-acetyltransferase [Pseudomonadota bacterium]|nr:homoserine O-acetyltransferase [Pseudomonadota bacterium]
MSAARKKFIYKGNFQMRRGGSLKDPIIAYETWGQLNSKRDNAIVIFTGLSPSAHASSSPEDPAPGWWEEIIGPSRPVDTNQHFVICINSLGSCFGSTGPGSINPATGENYRLDFPVLTLEDIANAGYAVLESLNIERLFALIGPSMGGMTSLAFACMYPGTYERLMLISTAARALPFAIAVRSLQREMIRKDLTWQDGNYSSENPPVDGMRLARKLGMMTYRSAEEWEQRFGRERISEERNSGDGFAMDFEIESYLDAHAAKFTGQFDPNCYLYLSRASDLFDIAEHGGSLSAGLSKIDANKISIIGVVSDLLFPIHQQRELSDGLKKLGRQVEYTELNSTKGHDSFLVDIDVFRPVIYEFLR